MSVLKNKNVLVTGIGQANYILQLYGNIVKKCPDFSFNILNLENFGNETTKERAEKIFDKNYYKKPNLKNFFTLLKAVPSVLSNSYFWKDLRIFRVEKGSLISNDGLRLILRHVNAFYYAKFIDDSTNTDIIHLHFPKHIFALFLKYLTKDYEVIVTYWGSDIYRIDSWKDHEIQNSSLNNVDLITAATPEMEFAILSRFGFQLKNKLRNKRFIHNNKFYEVADILMKNRNWIIDFKKRYNIKKEKIVLLFGHNAHIENNHLEFLEILKGLPRNIVSDFHIIFPFSYGDNSGDYQEQLREITKTIECDFIFLTDFLGWEDLAKLKIISDVYIHAPITDGLSAFLTEFFYTNNLAIVGSWLPYNTFLNFGVDYLKFDDFDSLGRILIDLKQLIEDKDEIAGANNKIVAENFSVEKISEEWVSLFKELT
ncbi:glycosyltransferase family 4 protein [Salegentibacter maritimus]|uniref:Glycosyltransferase family 4 protein n=1 Tax=Salegentibacter maritimus TaxID=2794347 RepID=A0ABS0TFE0_9FLAO|nr:glycosyltransferase family 4 protein [Salegentibacter maritimus]MBI6119765.1 glycosyltransferase family 4 protein [Salegentibacter maritimus]